MEVTNFILNGIEQGVNASAEVLTGYATVSGMYDLAVTYCAPDQGHGKTLQILTHGIGFDRSYWDLSFNNYSYSYVETAVDRTPIPLSVVQAPLEQAALQGLTTLAWSGSVPGVSAKFNKVMHVGHSFGSELSYGLARDMPSLSSGLVLTGFSTNCTFLPNFEAGGNFVSVTTVPALGSKYVARYLASSDQSAVQTDFFAPGMFDPAILTLAYQTSQPVSLAELLTTGGEAGGIATHLTGPVLVITGGRDLPYCGGNCLATGNPSLPSIPAAVQQSFPNTSKFGAFVVPGAGHGLNLEYSKDTTYQHISQFLVGNGF